MNKSLFIFLLISIPCLIFGQASNQITTVETAVGQIIIPGQWNKIYASKDTGQIYFTNQDSIIIAVAQNPKKAYPFFKDSLTNYELVNEYYTWDADWREENNFATAKLKEDPEREYVIWKYNDGKQDNVFLFGSQDDNFINLLVYFGDWNDNQKIAFLEESYFLNAQNDTR